MRGRHLRRALPGSGPYRGRTWPALALALVCLGASACGGSSGAGVANISATTSRSTTATAGGPSTSDPYTKALDYARCMRQHGEPAFPDPRNPGGFSTAALERLDTRSRQYADADGTCRRLLPNGGQPTPAEVQQAITDGLRFARCMRDHGVPFPDPGISGSRLTIDLANVDTSSPQYAAATKACATQPGG